MAVKIKNLFILRKKLLLRQLDIARDFSGVLRQKNIKHWLGGGIAWEIHNQRVENPIRHHDDIDFFIIANHADEVTKIGCLEELSSQGINVTKPIDNFITKLGKLEFTTTENEHLETPFLFSEGDKMYFLAWDESKNLKKFFCYVNYFQNDSWNEIPIVNRKYCELYNDDGKKKT
ncbi:hypothetical protein ACFL0Z_00430 [Patescibacteria group bacterium]